MLFEPVPGVRESLYVHPLMLSRWRKQARENFDCDNGAAVDEAVAEGLNTGRWSLVDHHLYLSHPACTCTRLTGGFGATGGSANRPRTGGIFAHFDEVKLLLEQAASPAFCK